MGTESDDCYGELTFELTRDRRIGAKPLGLALTEVLGRTVQRTPVEDLRLASIFVAPHFTTLHSRLEQHSV